MATRIFCKKCGKDITCRTNMFYLKDKNFIYKLPSHIVEIYKGFIYAPSCSKCGEVIDYKELDLNYFWVWLAHATEGNNDSNLKGKALIRYFGLAELLQCNTTKEV